MRTARWIFWAAGAYGLVVLVPQYFLLDRIDRRQPPAVTHPEYFYGFVGLAIIWQLAFLLIGYDPGRYRLVMLIGILEKVSFAVPVAVLFAQQQVAASTLVFGLIDLLLAGLFFVAWRMSAGSKNADTSISQF